MKKLILLALAAVMMVGCDNRERIEIDGEDVVIIDSCEYFVFSTYTDVGYSHKGNCRFCQERRQQELKELVKQIKGE